MDAGVIEQVDHRVRVAEQDRRVRGDEKLRARLYKRVYPGQQAICRLGESAASGSSNRYSPLPESLF